MGAKTIVSVLGLGLLVGCRDFKEARGAPNGLAQVTLGKADCDTDGDTDAAGSSGGVSHSNGGSGSDGSGGGLVGPVFDVSTVGRGRCTGHVFQTGIL